MPSEQREQFQKKQDDIYPAIEASIYDAFDTFQGSVTNMLPEKFDQLGPENQLKALYHFLGFGFYTKSDSDDPDAYVELPDHDALIARWKLVMVQYPELPALDILAAPGIAGDIDFIEAYFTHDALSSDGIEFFHDRMAHVVRTIMFIWNEKEHYQRQKFQYAKEVMNGYKQLMAYKYNVQDTRDKVLFTPEAFKLLETSVGLAADFSSARRERLPPLTENYLYLYNNILGVEFGMPEGSAERVFLAKIGISSKDDLIEWHINWIRLQLATAHMFGLPEIPPLAAEILLKGDDKIFPLAEEILFNESGETRYLVRAALKQQASNKLALNMLHCRVMPEAKAAVSVEPASAAAQPEPPEPQFNSLGM